MWQMIFPDCSEGWCEISLWDCGGDGTSDQFQYYLYDRYEAKAVGDPGVGSTGVYQCVYHCDVCVFETLFFKKIIPGGIFFK